MVEGAGALFSSLASSFHLFLSLAIIFLALFSFVLHQTTSQQLVLLLLFLCHAQQGTPTYSGTKRATGDLLVSKLNFQTVFQIFNITQKWISGFLDFIFFWISGRILGTKKATGDPRVSKREDF